MCYRDRAREDVIWILSKKKKGMKQVEEYNYEVCVGGERVTEE